MGLIKRKYDFTDVDDYKEALYEKIDKKTGELIDGGFVFDGKTFSLSKNAQINWSEIHTNKAIFSFPLSISTKDNDEYDLAEADVDTFWGTAMTAKKTHLDSGRALKKQVLECTTIAELDAIEDNR